MKKNIFTYSLKELWGFSKSRTICEFIVSMLTYIETVFFSTYFIRYVIEKASIGQFSEAMPFIAGVTIFFFFAALYKSWASSVLVYKTDRIIYKKLYSKLYKKALNVELRCFEDADFYNKYTLAAKDAISILISTVKSFIDVVFGTIALAVIFYNMFMIDKYVIIFVLFPMVGSFVFKPKMNKINSEIVKKSARFVRITDYVNRTVHLADFAREIRLTGIFSVLRRKYSEAVDKQIDISLSYSKKNVFLYWCHSIFTFTFIFEGVLIYGVIRTAVSYTMGLSQFAVLTSVMVSAAWTLIALTQSWGNYHKNSLLLDNIFTFLNYEEKIPENYEGEPAPSEIKSIEFRNVSFSYDGKKNVIDNLSLKISGKSAVAFVGINGAGKSTLIKLLYRLYDPDSGEILLNDINIKKFNLQSYRTLFSGAFQDYRLFACSIRENILMKRAEYTDQETENVINVLKKVDLYNKISSFCNSIDTMITKEFSDQGICFSGGGGSKNSSCKNFL